MANSTRIDKGSEAIILLHGLARTGRSMNKAAKLFAAYGYKVINVDYPSRRETIETLARSYIDPALQLCSDSDIRKIHFLSHSMGGILLRYYLSDRTIEKLGRVVMLAPPNRGSEIVDRLKKLRLFYYWNGPAGLQLGTGKDSTPNRLGPVNFELGVIAGGKSLNPFYSRFIPGADDGKVSVESTRVAGMKDHLVAPYSHTFIMQRRAVIEQALHFIQHGCFAR